MPASVTTAAGVEPGIDDELAALAVRSGRTTSELMAEAPSSYLASARWSAEAVQSGIEDLEAGRLVDHDAVAARVGGAMRPTP